MKFIHFGCWNKGKCDLSNPGSQPVSAVIASIKQYIDKEETKPTFITIAGDNYYPDYKEGIKIQNYDNFKSGFDCLEKLENIKKYIIFGNHDYDDIYKTDTTVIDNPYFEQKDLSCVNLISQQKLLDDKSDFKIFNNVLYEYDSDNKTLVIMIDTNIYVDDPKIYCYKYVFNSGIENVEKKIEHIRQLQLEQVKTIISKNESEKIIFIGHQPIIYCRTRTDNYIKHLDNFISFFNELEPDIKGKIIKYLCADVHFYQRGIITLTNKLEIEQFIIGSGGTYYCDKVCQLNKLENNTINNKLLTYKIIKQEQEYGYLVYDNGNIEFKKVPFHTASYTIIDSKIIPFNKNFNKDEKIVCSQIGNENRRKYKIYYN